MNTHVVPPPVVPPGAPVLKAAEVAFLLRIRNEETFRNKRRALEEAGFPPKLPGINGWSRAAVLRWIETNGGSFLPPAPEPADALSAEALALEEEYAR